MPPCHPSPYQPCEQVAHHRLLHYCRVEGTKVGSRQIGRRSIVTFAALVVRGDSPVQTPQQFANRQIGVRRISANKRAYLHYFLDYYKNKDPEIAKLTIDDLREGRIYVVDPAPIPPEELQRTYDWMKSWGFLDETPEALELVNMHVQKHGYEQAAAH